MQIGRSRIESGFDAQRPAGPRALFQALLQIFFANDLDEALLQVGELFGDRGKGHSTIVEWLCIVNAVRLLLLMSSLTLAAAAQTLSDRFFDEYYFPFNPTSATSAGIHKYDGQLEDYSAAGIAAKVAALRRFETDFAKLPADPDRDLVLSNIRASLLDLDTIRNWE